MPSDQQDLEAARAFSAARDAATPGPWTVNRRHSNGCEIVPRITCPPDKDRGCGWIADLIGAPYLGHQSTLPNADFIALARNSDLPERVERLVAEVERLRAITETLREVLRCYGIEATVNLQEQPQ